jgi:ferredoxin
MMAWIDLDGKRREVKDGAATKEACKELGVFFSCEQGICGACRSDVLEGVENLGEKNEAEKDWSIRGNERLMCQCKIGKGEIKIRQW